MVLRDASPQISKATLIKMEKRGISHTHLLNLYHEVMNGLGLSIRGDRYE